MSYSVDTSFIEEVGQSVNEIYANDPDQNQWFTDTIDYYNNNDYQFPENTLKTIVEYIESHNGDNSYSDILNKIHIIENNDDGENLLSSIFFPNDSPTEEEEEGQELPDDFEEEEEEATDTPSAFFKSILNNTQSALCISPEITYLLLKKYGWNKDMAFAQWFNSQDEIFKSLRLNIGSQMVPNLQSSLDIKECETAQCPICHKNAQLLQLYCGHKICHDCLNSELETQINQGKLPFCHQQADDHKECNAEIIIKTLEDHNLLEKYKKAVLKDKLDNNNIDVRACPNPRCGHLISSIDKISKNFGRCSHCHTVTCVKCTHGMHAPLDNCSKIDEFCYLIPIQMCQLLADQEKWEKREVRLSDHRCKNNSEVQKALDDLTKNYSKEQDKEITNEKTKLQEYTANNTRLNKEIENIKTKLRDSMNDPKVRSEIPQLSRKILAIRQEIEKNEREKTYFNNTIQNNDESRKFNFDSVKKNNNILIEGLKNSTTYQTNIDEYHKSLFRQAYLSIAPMNLDIENIDLQSEVCPKCKSKILRFSGLNQMKCTCGFKLCKICKKKWDDNHVCNSVCPKYLTEITKYKDTKSESHCGINFDDLNDKKFYLPPMSFDKCSEYILFENYYTMFLNQKDFYNNLETELYGSADTNSPTSTNEQDTIRNRLIKCYQEKTSKSEAISNVDKLINTVLFSQSIMIWGYPTLYFCLKEGKNKEANLIRNELYRINSNSISLIVSMKNSSSQSSTQFYNTEKQRLENQIKEFLDNTIDHF